MLEENAAAFDTNDSKSDNPSPDDNVGSSPWESISQSVSGDVPASQTVQPDANAAAGTETNLNGLLQTGLHTGAASGGLWHAADDAYMRLPAAVQNSNKYFKFFGDHLSPISRELASLANTPGISGEAAGTSAAAEASLHRYGQVVANKVSASALAQGEYLSVNAPKATLDSARYNLLTRSRGLGYANALGQGASIGLAIAGVNIAADYVLSNALGEDPRLTGTSAWGLEALALPLIAFNPKLGIASKIGLSGAAYAGSHIFGSLVGEPTGRFSALGRPSLPEIGLSTVGAMLPLKDWRVRALAATVGWGLGKAYAIATNDGHEPKPDGTV